MKAHFLGGKLHGQELDDPCSQTYKHKHGGIPKRSIGRAWTVSRPDYVDLYIRHESMPIYCLKGYDPTLEDELEVRERIGIA